MKQFYHKDDVNKKPITIVNEKETFYHLSDGQMIKKGVFSKYYSPVVNESVTPKFSSDHIDPETFFSVQPDIPIEKLKSVDTSRMKDGPEGAIVTKNTSNQVKAMGNIPATPPVQQPNQAYNESIVRQVPEGQPIPNHTNTDVSMYKVYDNDDDAYDDFVRRSQQPQQQQPQATYVTQEPKKILSEIDVLFEDEKLTFGEEEATRRRNSRLKRVPAPNAENNSVGQTGGSTYSQTQQVTDPSEIMFRTFKRNHEITINVTFKDKIGKPEFVKMMIENMEGDIIQYYKKLLMGNIMKNLGSIEKEIEKNLRLEIFGSEEEITKEKEEEITDKLDTSNPPNEVKTEDKKDES